MAKAPVLSNVLNVSTSAPTINSNNNLIQQALENTLSRDGSTPNQMEADIDLNGHDLLNVGDIDVSGNLHLNGAQVMFNDPGLTKDWATTDEDVEVDPDNFPDEYSAYHYMKKAEGYASEAASSAGKADFNSLTSLLDSIDPIPLGTVVTTRKEGHIFEVVNSGEHLITDGGVKLKNIPNKNFVANVGDFLAEGKTDRQAIDEAIASLPATGRSRLRLPYKGSPWAIDGPYIQYGARQVTWEIDDAVVFSPANHIAKLNAPTIQARMYRNPGFANRRDTTGLTIISGGGLLDDAASISGFDTIQQQAYSHERGMASLYMSAGDSGMVKIPAANFTATSIIPLTPIDLNPLRVGMFVDVPGTTIYALAATARFTSRITGWAADGSSIEVGGWWRNGGGQTAVQETPPNGRRVVINPKNKIWGGNINVYLNQTDGADYGEVSGSWLECALINNTGKDAGGYFDLDTHPLHFYGFDASHKTDATGNGGGISFMSRGQHQSWWRGFESQAATIGFHNTNTGRNLLSSTAFCASHGTEGGAGTAFLSRSMVGPTWQRNVSIAGDAPRVEIGRTSIASTPSVEFHSSGLSANYDARISASGGTSSAGGGALRLQAATLTLDSLLTTLDAADIRLTNLPTSAPASSGRLWRDGTTLRIVP